MSHFFKESNIFEPTCTVTTQNAKFNGHIKEMFAFKNESKGDLFEKRGPDTCVLEENLLHLFYK